MDFLNLTPPKTSHLKIEGDDWEHYKREGLSRELYMLWIVLDGFCRPTGIVIWQKYLSNSSPALNTEGNAL